MNLIKNNNKYYLSKESNKYYGVGYQGLKFTATQNNSSVGYTVAGTPTGSDMKYSYNGSTWNSWDGTAISLNENEFICVKGNNPNGLNKNSIDYINFTMSNNILASGNINSLLDNGDGSTITTIPNNNCFIKLFYNCASLISAPYLPALNLKSGCYVQMFSGCSSLTTCFDLPATTLANSCYNSMFYDCRSLLKAPIIYATTLADYCFSQMFSKCNSLNYIKLYYTGDFSIKFLNWVNNVSSIGNFYYNGSSTSRGSSAIPNNWTIHTF